MEEIMTGLFIALAVYVVLLGLVYPVFYALVSINLPRDGPRGHADPITTYVRENYGRHFRDDDSFGAGRWREF